MELHLIILRVLRAIPRPARWFGTFFLVASLTIALAYALGLRRGLWMIIVGLLVIFLLVWVFNLFVRGRQQKKARDFEGQLGLQSREAGVGREEIRHALAELAEQWKKAVQQLRERGLSLYDLPWYLLIGEPQSGKSTTIKNSNLEFPVGTDALSGAGGTRNCDWWFSNEAVILDTAGRFTFPEETAPDRHEWEAFLKLLSKHRKFCPINGVIVVIPATSLVEDPPEEQEAKAKNIRQKLLHLQTTLGIRFPVFVLVTKADRILGFAEFFSRLEPLEQRQLFGWSNPQSFEKAWDPGSFPQIFDDLVRRVHKLRLKLLREEGDLHQVDKLFVFPEELAAVGEPLAQYLHTIFAVTRYEEPFIFRGFYLTSGVQEGRPIARACRDLLRVQMGDPEGVLEDLESVFQRSRAYFIRDFYSEKVFKEQGLVAPTRAALKKEQTSRYALWGSLAAAGVLFLALLLPSAFYLRSTLGKITETAERAERCLGEDTEPCGVLESWHMIEDLEKSKQALVDSKWRVRVLLGGGEVTQELLPSLQAALFRRGVLLALLDSVENRAAKGLWAEDSGYGGGYDLFLAALEQSLGLRELQRRTLGEEERLELRRGLSLEPVVEFLRLAPGFDSSPSGQEIDDWLAADGGGDSAYVDEIFQAMLATWEPGSREQIDVAAVRGLEEPDASFPSLRAFRDFWSLPNLARREFTLLETYFKGFEASYEDLLATDAAAAESQAVVASYVEQAGRLEDLWQAGAQYMGMQGGGVRDGDGAARSRDGGEPGAAQEEDGQGAPGQEWSERRRGGEAALRQVGSLVEGDRPGAGPEPWRVNCLADTRELESISPQVFQRAGMEEHCEEIPQAWSRLLRDLDDYRYLYQETGAEGSRRYAWSEGAEKVFYPLTELAERVAPETVETDSEEFRDLLADLRGARARVEEIRNFYEQQEKRVAEPEQELRDFERSRPATELEAARAADTAAGIAALSLAQRVLPPIETYFVEEVFAPDCESRSCYTLGYAKDNVPPANEFLHWASEALGPARRSEDVAARLDRIDNAVYDYLSTFVGRETGSFRGGSAGGFDRPARAARADTWSDFARELRRWRPIAAARSAPMRTSGGLTVEALQDFSANNDRLRPLVEDFRRAASRSAAASASPVEVSGDLRTAAEAFQGLFNALDDDPLAAWRQLALDPGDGATLGDFHAFSANPRLKRDSDAQWMVDNVETRGAKLLSEEIRPVFEERFEELWRQVGRCCADRFPFLGRRRLERERESYALGLRDSERRGGGVIWAGKDRFEGRREVRESLLLESVGWDALDRLFFEGESLDKLFRDFALDPLVDGTETAVDFVGERKSTLSDLRGWQRFLYGEDQRPSTERRTFQVQLLGQTATPNGVYLGERVAEVRLFGADRPIRTSTDAGRQVVREAPLALNVPADHMFTVCGTDEAVDGWTGCLEVRGGPLKLLYLVHLAAEGRPREDGRVWTVRLAVPDFRNPSLRPEALFELTFDRPVPGVLPAVEEP
jgi:hypothetical protein